jgi:peptidoglycan/LPS O-acetylase OafA/YrhL
VTDPRATVRLPALDGWRGIAILLVLADHFQPIFLHAYPVACGKHGVTAFFVLSGYLITGKLRHSNRLGVFYTPRMFRLMPVAWCYLAFVALIGSGAPQMHLSVSEFVSSLLFVRNYFDLRFSSHTLHFWSLSIEEQFYLIWPALLLWLGMRRAKWIALASAVGSALWLATHHSFYSAPFMNLRTEVRGDALLVGCAMALFLNSDVATRLFNRWTRWAFWPTTVYLAWVSLYGPDLSSLLECCAWGVVIVYSTMSAPRFLTIRPLVWLGRISYSVYVWNLMAMQLYVAARGYFVIQMVAVGVPVLSYYLIERPCTDAGRSVRLPFSRTKALKEAV